MRFLYYTVSNFHIEFSISFSSEEIYSYTTVNNNDYSFKIIILENAFRIGVWICEYVDVLLGAM